MSAIADRSRALLEGLAEDGADALRASCCIRWANAVVDCAMDWRSRPRAAELQATPSDGRRRALLLIAPRDARRPARA